tara:strand:- start:1850 stop:2425 length:576 start_codon:yes stop_codon:yes gene_type:complete
MIIKQSAAPDVEPVSVDEVKSQLVWCGDADDTLISSMIPVARQIAEQRTGRAFITQSWDRWYDAFPAQIVLPWAPLQSITAVTYTDIDGDIQTLDTSVYTADSDSEPGRVYLGYGQSWPSTRCMKKAVKVSYVAGFGDAAEDVPAQLRLAIMLLVGSLLNNREDDAPLQLHKVPWGVEQMLADYKMYRRAC